MRENIKKSIFVNGENSIYIFPWCIVYITMEVLVASFSAKTI